MPIVSSIDQIRPHIEPGTILTIGNFDGVHVGHQSLIHTVRSKAIDLGLTSVVVTFDPHPLQVIKGEVPPFITPTPQKLRLLSSQGLDFVLCLEFTKEISQLSAESFVRDYLVEGLRVRHLIIGHDYTFGKGRRGNFELLQKMGREHGFCVKRMEAVSAGNEVVSSTRIRSLIQAGQVWDARPLLGRFYQVAGSVIKGHQRGGPLLGIPTANLELTDKLFPKPGVYAVWGEHGQSTYPGVANVGYSPTFNQEALSVEVHLFNFQRNIYGQTLKVHFVKRLRDEKKFSGIEELMSQIKEDIGLAKEILSQEEASVTYTP